LSDFFFAVVAYLCISYFNRLVGLRQNGDEWKEGYTVDRICGREDIDTDRDRNRGLNVAISALAGYSPVLPDLVRNDLLSVYKDPRGIGKMALPEKDGISAGNDIILWKYSYRDIDWRPTKVEGVDYGAMLMGLAALPELLGVEFFQEYNNFFSPAMSDYRR